ncbi:hypothetical protein CDAR_115411 [Caerostris darwini]|uniref:Uncharacterized protein n=1 Tax=Caerostris darwini TaxID=1538125 RepID=A0AAV4UA05_9ARAC|nr:hypothetical protein CDAR_115411 [Caerostris darwini]
MKAFYLQFFPPKYPCLFSLDDSKCGRTAASFRRQVFDKNWIVIDERVKRLNQIKFLSKEAFSISQMTPFLLKNTVNDSASAEDFPFT